MDEPIVTDELLRLKQQKQNNMGNKINEVVLRTSREKVAEYLRGIMDHKRMDLIDVADAGGIDLEKARAVITGMEDYSIDDFLAVTHALDCYFYLADRGGKHLDGDDLVTNAKDPI